MASTYELIVQAVDKTSRPLGVIEKNLDSLNRKASTVSTTLRAAGGALVAFATGSTLRSIVTTTARFEDLRDTLDTVTGSAEKGGKAFDFIQKFATQTQFGVEDLTTTFIKLQGAGITPTAELLTTFTDTAAVTTDQLGTLNAMTDLFSRTTAGGLGLEELNRLADRGVPVFRILEEQLGLTRLEISDFGKTAEGARTITEALTRGLNASFGGATQGKLDNLSTAMSNFGIEITLAANKIGTQFRPQLTAAITEATAFIQENDKLLKAIGTDLGTAVTTGVEALKFLASNITLIRNAALAWIGIRFAGNLQGILAAANQASGGTKNLTTMLGKLGQVLSRGVVGKGILAIGELGLGITRVAGYVGGLIMRFSAAQGAVMAFARLAPLLLNPWTAALTAIGVAVYSVFKYFEDTYFKIGDTTTSVGELVRAVWWKVTEGIKQAWQGAINWVGEKVTALGNAIGEVWNDIKNAASEYIDPIVNNFSFVYNQVKTYTTTFINNIIGAFVFIGKSIWETIKQIPQMFGAIFSAIKTIVLDFASRIVTQFGNIGEAIKLAMMAPFTDATFEDALAAATRNAFAGMGEVVSAEMDAIGKTMPDYGRIAGESFTGEYTGAIGEGMQNVATYFGTVGGQLVQSARNTWNGITATVGENIELVKTELTGLIGEYRAHNFAVGLASGAYDMYDDAILRSARGLGVYSEASAAATAETAAAANTLTELQTAYSELLAEANKAINAENIRTQMLQQLRADLEAGTITQRQFNAALKELNIDNTNASLSQYQQYLQGIISTAQTAANEIGFKAQALQDLRAQLDSGAISLDVYAQAVERLTPSTAQATTTLKSLEQAFADTLASANQTIATENQRIQIIALLRAQLDAGTISQRQFNAALKELNVDAANAGAGLSQYQQYLQGVISTAQTAANEVGFKAQALQDLRAQLDSGAISLDVYAQAVERLNPRVRETARAAGAAAPKLQTFNEFMTDLAFSSQQTANQTQYYRDAVAALDKMLAAGTISQEAYAVAMKRVQEQLGKTADAAKSTADIIKDGFKSAGSSLTKDLATALRTGSGIMDSFKNYFNSALDSILQAIIEKNITQPLVNQINGFIDGVSPNGQMGSGMVRSMSTTLSNVNGTVSTWGGGLGNIFSNIFSNIGGLFQGFGSGISGFFGKLFGGFGGGGGGFFGNLFGGISSFAGGLFGGIGSIFGFANGGVPPVNRPSIVGERGPELFVPSTTGRVVPNKDLGMGGGSTNVTFEINAISTRDGIEFLLENKPAIINMVQQASNKRGKAGILD